MAFQRFSGNFQHACGIEQIVWKIRLPEKLRSLLYSSFHKKPHTGYAQWQTSRSTVHKFSTRYELQDFCFARTPPILRHPPAMPGDVRQLPGRSAGLPYRAGKTHRSGGNLTALKIRPDFCAGSPAVGQGSPPAILRRSRQAPAERAFR